MQLAILHYHLNHGGVSRVVENHLKALARAEQSRRPTRVLLIQGRIDTNWPHDKICHDLPFPVELVTVGQLDYDDPDAAANEILGEVIENALASADCPADDTLLHWHNHALGKNVSTPLAVRRLATRGYRTLLQIHDFAEDFRPENYRKLNAALASHDDGHLSDVLYPQSAHIHYAVLNRRDHNVLSRLGVKNSRLHLVQNPVAVFGVMPEGEASRQRINALLELPASARLLCYPVRGIRRKNVGEMLLWSAMLDDTWFFITLAPENPIERPSFDRWHTLAAELELPCRFGTPVGTDLSFTEILAGSDALVTTSVAEGFGMAFLEAWIAGRQLAGRNLPEITSDACEAGLDLGNLYSELLVPCSWINRHAFTDQLDQILRETYDSFGIDSPPKETIDQQLSRLLEPETIDFARLPSELQADLIRRVHKDTTARAELLSLNPKLHISDTASDLQVAANATVVSKHYSLSELGKRLVNVYTQLFECKATPVVSGPALGGAVLDEFLSIDRLYAIRVQP